jgi:hypothetical protein
VGIIFSIFSAFASPAKEQETKIQSRTIADLWAHFRDFFMCILRDNVPVR